MKNKIDFYSRITIGLVLALLTSQLLVKEVFLGYTPRIRPDLADIVVEKTLTLVNIDNYLALFRGKPTELPQTGTIAKTPAQAKQELAKVPFKPTIVKGVYAKETADASLIEMRFSEVEWVKVKYQKKDGTIIDLNIPKGTQPPPAGMF